MSLRVAIVHYHLRRGGVTRVVRDAARALLGRGARVAVLTGEPPEEEPDPGLVVEEVEGLGYAEATGGGRMGAVPELAPVLEAAARRALGGSPDVWHVHNHSLGKNAALPAACAGLAGRGAALILQIHDFAEDFRPANWRLLCETLPPGEDGLPALYPQAPRVAYAVLNRRDRRALAAAGVEDDRLVLLPNAVAPAVDEPGEERAPAGVLGKGRWRLYPTRAIRRKNVGEFLLWSALAPEGERFATTLAPLNPRERPQHERWRRVAAELGLPVEFAVGERPGQSFARLVRAAWCLLTTSVAEGFGLAFLEPWLLGRSVVGRDLPEITADFAADGVELPGLYERLEVPIGWVGEDRLRRKLARAIEATARAYGRPPSGRAVKRALDAAVGPGGVDVGALDEELQEEVIRRAVASSSARDEVRPRELAPPAGPATVARNAEAIRGAYGIEGYAERLLELYGRVTGAPSAPLRFLPAGRVLDRFLRPEAFRLLRS